MRRISGVWVAVALASAGLLTSSLAVFALAVPSSFPSLLLNLAPSHESRAHALLSGDAPNLASATHETMLSLRQAPANPTAWLRLAYIDSLSDQGLGPAGVDALSRSYDVAPHGPDDTPWRLRFAFNHWTRLDRPTRLLVLAELETALRSDDSDAFKVSDDIADPAGRLAVRLTTEEIRRARRREAKA